MMESESGSVEGMHIAFMSAQKPFMQVVPWLQLAGVVHCVPDGL